MRHLTKRALARLAGRDWIDLPVGHLACAGEYTGRDGTATGVLDVRGGLTPENRPTCPKCAVLLDQDLEGQDVSPDGAACAARSARITSAW